MINRILAWLWSLLPDRCQNIGCQRKGIRGNENVVDGVILCDYCHDDLLERGRE
jgi:hypothetical protein